MRTVLLLILALVTVTGALIGQRYSTQTYGVREGLPSTEVASLAQDGVGRIWMATRVGLVIYDGATWETDSPPDFRSGTALGQIRCDSQGRIWCCTDAQVYVREQEGWRDLPPFTDRARPGRELPIELIVMEIEGRLCPIVALPSGRLLIHGDDRWRTLLVDADRSCAIRSVVRFGALLVVATDRDLRVIDPASYATTVIAEEGANLISALAEDRPRGGVWCVAGEFIGFLEIPAHEGEGAPRFRRVAELGDETRRMFRHSLGRARIDGRGGLYFGDQFQTAHFAPEGGLQLLGRENGLISGGAHDILLDREQNAWIATSRGLTKVVSRRLAGWSTEHGLLSDEVTAIVETPRRTLIFGHDTGGLTELDGTKTRIIRLEKDGLTGRVMDLAQASDGTIWVACEYLGLFRISFTGPAAEPEIENVAIGAQDSAATVEFDREGRLWVGSLRGLAILENGVLRRIEIESETPLVQVRRLVLGPSGRLWATSVSAGLVMIEGEKARAISEPPDRRSTFTALELRDGRVLVGTRDGLCFLDDGRIEDSESPAVRRPVYGLVADAAGRIWIGTDNGIYRWNGRDLDHIGAEHGLYGLEINRAANILDGRGRLWVGTDRGAFCFLPGEEARESTGPTASIVKIDAAGDSLPLAEESSLGPEQDDLTFQIRSISFIDEERVLFSIWLEGLDEAPAEPRPLPLRTIRYQNLRPGRYRLHIRPIDVEGRVGVEEVSPWIEIAPQFWEETWFVAAAFLLVALVGAGSFGYVQQRRSRRQLEAEVRARTEELRRAAESQERVARLDSLGLLAGGIAHDFNNILTALGGNIALIGADEGLSPVSRRMLDLSEKACTKAQGLTRQLLTFSRGGDPIREVVDLGDVLRDAVEFSLRGSSVDCRFEIATGLPPVEIDVGQYHQVFSNIVINARQAMGDAGRLEVRARVVADGGDAARRLLLVEIQDRGPGMAPEVLDRIFDPYFTTKSEGSGLGLSIAHSIVHKHGGRLEVESKPGAGTTFRIYLVPTDRALAATARATPTRERIEGRILVMDDQDEVRAYTRSVLEGMGAEVVEAAEGRAAIEAVTKATQEGRPFAAVILDLTVPGGLGGVEAGREILARDPGARIIVTSGYSRDAVLAEYERHGFRARLPKPFGPDDLARAIDRALR